MRTHIGQRKNGRALLVGMIAFAPQPAFGSSDYDYLYPHDPLFERAQSDAPPLVIPGPRNVTADPVSVNVNDRESVRQLYLSEWANKQFPDFAQHWNGNYSAKTPGDITPTWRKLLLARLNAYRALAGVRPFDGTNKYWDDYSQDGAFALSINNKLTHELRPADAPHYWTHRAAVAVRANAAAARAAHQTMLPIDNFVTDYGNNLSVGHRGSLLTITGQNVGIGHVPFWNGSRAGLSANADVSACVVQCGYDYTAPDSNPQGTTRERFVTWPSRGFFPLQLLTSARWSLTNDLYDPTTTFGRATVEIYQDGHKLPTSFCSQSNLAAALLVDPAQATGGIHPWNTNSALTLPEPTSYPAFPGRDVRFTIRVRNLEEFFDRAAQPDYIYNIVVFDATAAPTQTAKTLVDVPLLVSGEKCKGSATQVLRDQQHPNRNIYDQLLLTGTTVTFDADPGQITRLSYIDLNDDIVQVEFSGRGRVHLELEEASGPARPVKYNQAVSYMKGHARIYVLDTDGTSNLSVFSVGRANAVNNELWYAGMQYDGVADIALVAIATTTGKMGGFYGGNASFFASSGFTGLYAPDVAFQSSVCRVHDIAAESDAIPVLLTGAVSEITVTGGSMYQPNTWPVQIGDATKIAFKAGSTSHNDPLPAQTSRASFTRNDAPADAVVAY